MSDRAHRIVVVDDEVSDRTFITKAFERAEQDHEVTVFDSGQAFLDHLAECKASGLPPDLLLLDLSLPAMSGLEVLSRIRSDDTFANLIVIVLTSSSYRVEVHQAYDAGANAFVTKPARLAQLDEFVRSIEQFWLGQAQLPYA